MNESSKAGQNSQFARWSPLFCLFAVALFVFLFVDAERSITGRPTMDMLIGLGVFDLGFYVWVRLASGFPTRNQIAIIGAAILIQACLFATVQMEGIYGNGRPVFAWRWAPLPADQFRSRFERPASGSVDIELPEHPGWPQFRGPDRNGCSSAAINDWSKQEPRERWRMPVGSGWSSFAVAGKYCFTMEQRGDEECTVCYEIETGNQVWVHADPERFSEISGGEGPRSTPAIDDGFLYTLGATGVLNCLDAHDGSKMWSVDVLRAHEGLNCYYGMCGSPLVAGNRVIISPGAPGASLVAYDKLNGSVVWQSGDAQASYSSPQLSQLCGIEQVLIFNGDGLYSHDLQSGEILWRVPWISNEAERNNVCQPIRIKNDRIFISSGYGRGSALFQIQRREGRFSVDEVWSNKKLRSKFASAVFDGRLVYGLDEGILVCMNPQTGERLWKSGRYGHGQLLLAGRYLIIQSEDGRLVQVLATGTGFHELARLDALDDRTWTHPVLVGQILLARNDREMVCFDVQ